jgi:(2Fe-2S) ferredoxin
MADQGEQLATACKKVGIGAISRHVFLCQGPKCCEEKVGEKSWDALKKALKDAGMQSGDPVCQRTRVGCLRICMEGPILLVYPEGTWYKEMTPDRIERFVREHLIEGRPIEEWIFARNPLPLPAP